MDPDHAIGAAAPPDAETGRAVAGLTSTEGFEPTTFAATGVRVRRLPIDRAQLSKRESS